MAAKTEGSEPATEKERRFRLLKKKSPLSPEEREARRRRRRRRTLQVLPSLLTLGNGAAGFSAIVHVAAIRFDPVSQVMLNPEHLAHAGWLLLLGMVFDGLDGRVARMTKTTNDFGGELDSLCDAVSFGVAPALMVVMSNARVIASPLWWKLAWLSGLIYVCGAILRLARFNVESSGHDVEAHMHFKGLPSPAAAGVIAMLAILQGYLRAPVSEISDLLGADARLAAARAITYVMPFVALATGWLMVSNVRYVHVGNRFLRGRRSIRRLAPMVFLLLAVAILPELFLCAIAAFFVASGPAGHALAVIRGTRGEPAPEDPEDEDEEDEDDAPAGGDEAERPAAPEPGSATT